MKKISTIVLFSYGLCLAACSEPVPQSESGATTPVVELDNTAPQGIIPQAQLDALEAAKATSAVLDEAQAARRKQLEGQ
jgi:hypothetical protein